MTRYGLLSYHNLNLGDEIQSLAARQFLPHVDQYVNRDSLKDVSESLMVILNGWWMHRSEGGRSWREKRGPYVWPPDANITPVLVSMHVAEEAKAVMASEESLRYLRRHGPVGCRDEATRTFFKSHNVPAYFSGCLTLTFPRNEPTSRKGMLFVDVPSRRIPDCPAFVRSAATKVVHSSREPDILKRLELAEERLAMYQRAELVVTSRLHCAIPCLALGTPVKIVGDVAKDARWSGMVEWFPKWSFDGSDWQLNKWRSHENRLMAVRERLVTACHERLGIVAKDTQEKTVVTRT
ncbi:MAG: polysaccharide pyruvyl transferase family protein [Pirellulaceae bacterium]